MILIYFLIKSGVFLLLKINDFFLKKHHFSHQFYKSLLYKGLSNIFVIHNYHYTSTNVLDDEIIVLDDEIIHFEEEIIVLDNHIIHLDAEIIYLFIKIMHFDAEIIVLDANIITLETEKS